MNESTMTDFEVMLWETMKKAHSGDERARKIIDKIEDLLNQSENN
ncbi:hypothetical protein AB1I77_28350 [Bacillus paranthracis]|uniref:Uncharacterized protein n=1 Tax=Bacillus mobilis TaxID=2026190 RepID=A0ABV4S293_9BACI|nr:MULTISPECIES: hypothetical protein [Bacillus cereus group]MCU5070512.1 hypothetical protein [Bacillus pacificus]